MKKIETLKIIFLSITMLLIKINSVTAQTVSHFEYINPVPNSQYVSVQNKIIIRQGNLIDRTSISNNLIEVTGAKSGNHSGTISLANDGKTLIFTPNSFFQADEDVTVVLKEGLSTQNGNQIGGLTFTFHTCQNSSPINYDLPSNKIIQSKIPPKPLLTVVDSSLPADLPPIVINQSNNPSPGYLFLSPSPYLMIVDNQGTPVFYRNVEGAIYDFDLQPNGYLTYFIYPVNCYGLDGSLNLVSAYNTVDGFGPDVHELHVLPNGDYYIFGKRLVTMDLSNIGGLSNAQLIDGALQEFDSSGNLIFEWDALAHYKITDVDDNIDLTQPMIDFSHFNSVATDSDGDLLISARNLDEITKVDPSTGNIIWRLGGKNNQFTFINDNLGFSRQHDIRRFSNGDISIFDNGTYHATPISSAVEYKLDEINKTATLVNRIYHDGIFTDTEGSVEELPNGNRFISWGHNWDPVVTEFTPDDSVAYELNYTSYVDTYRAFRYKWETNLFTTNTDSLDFGNVSGGTTVFKTFTVYNPHDTAVTINQLYCPDSSFSSNSTLPVTIQPNDSAKITVAFKPLRQGSYSTSFNIRDISFYQGTQQMIARQVIVSGSSNNTTSVNGNGNVPGQFLLEQNYPNPFNPSTIISYQIPKDGLVTLKVFDALGREVKTLVDEFKSQGKYSVSFDASHIASGVYFYQLRAGDFVSIKKMILLK
ncbi:MAG: arylsulfotransferase family protein [Ignavibacteriaceae bacterium]